MSTCLSFHPPTRIPFMESPSHGKGKKKGVKENETLATSPVIYLPFANPRTATTPP